MALGCVRSYREHMADFSEMKVLDLWYVALDADHLISRISDLRMRQRVIKGLARGRKTSVVEDIFPKLADAGSGAPVIKDKLPTIYHWKGHSPGAIHQIVADGFARYRETLSPAPRSLLDRYEARDAAVKVVGVGSIGTMCWIMLLMAADGDPLFLQIKEARASVLEPYAGKSVYTNHGQRIVNGHKFMQPASDIFLGWSEGKLGRHYYIRQLKDVKIKFAIESSAWRR